MSKADLVDSLREALTAANARIAELEARRVHVEAEHKRLFEEKLALLEAANARAEAAEQAHDKADEAYARWRDRAESEAAALRAEVEWTAAYRAYLSGQPAAPARTEGECMTVTEEPGGPHMPNPAEWERTEAEQTPPYRATCRACAAPLDRETGRPLVSEQALQGARDALRELNPRVITEAEQRVLDAWAIVDTDKIRRCSETHTGPYAVALRAELARRGLQ